MAVAENDIWLDEDGARLLCAYIVRKAAKDYYQVCLQPGKWDTEYRQKQLKEFFESEYYKQISGIDARHLMRTIEYRAKHGIKLFKGGDWE